MAATDPNADGPGWHAASKVETPPREPLTLELDVDVCVVGGGLAGLTAALESARRGWSVVLLEARRIAWNASGANTGFVRPGYVTDVHALIEKVGHDHARTLWGFSEAGADHVRRTIHETRMPGVEIEERGWLHVSKTGTGKLARYCDLIGREFGATAEYWPVERVLAQLRSSKYFDGIFFPNAFSINPVNYALGLAAAAEAAGARIFEGTPVLDIDPAGVRKRITTPSARLRAGNVVLAGNVHIGSLMPDLAETLVPISNYIVVTAPLGDRLREAVRFRGSVSDTESADNHYQVVADDRLMWSGRCTVWPGERHRYGRSLAGDIARTFPQLGKVEIEYAWSGISGNTVHGMPQIGELSPGVWLLSGFGTHGINTAAMGGELVARAIVEGHQGWRAFLPFELVWAGGRLGRAAVQTHYWYFRTRERLEAALARRRRDAHLPEIGPSPDEPAGPEPVKPRKRRRRKSKSGAQPVADESAATGQPS